MGWQSPVTPNTLGVVQMGTVPAQPKLISKCQNLRSGKMYWDIIIVIEGRPICLKAIWSLQALS